MNFNGNIARRCVGVLLISTLSLAGCTSAPIVTLPDCPDRVTMTHEIAGQVTGIDWTGRDALRGWITDQIVQDEQVDACWDSAG